MSYYSQRQSNQSIADGSGTSEKRLVRLLANVSLALGVLLILPGTVLTGMAYSDMSREYFESSQSVVQFVGPFLLGTGVLLLATGTIVSIWLASSKRQKQNTTSFPNIVKYQQPVPGLPGYRTSGVLNYSYEHSYEQDSERFMASFTSSTPVTEDVTTGYGMSGANVIALAGAAYPTRHYTYQGEDNFM